MVFLENTLWVLILIGVMILIHELGHYWAARAFDVRVEAFSFGFGPRLFGFRKGDTDFRFSLIPFGGYVKMAGEQAGDAQTDDPNSFLAKPRWQRLIIALAGPAMNVILAIGLLTGLFMVQFHQPVDHDKMAIVGHVLPDSPAAQAGIQRGDRIARIEGTRNPNWEAVLLKEIASPGRALSVTLERGDERIETSVTPKLDERAGVGLAGWFEETEIQIAAVSPGMPAERAGLRPGDILVTVDGKAIRSRFTLQEVIRASEGRPVEVIYIRDGEKLSSTMTPELTKIDGSERYMIGVDPAQRFITTRLSFPAALNQSVQQNLKSATLIYQFLVGIVEQRMSAKSLEGPIRIAQLSGDAARQGPATYLALMSMVSLNLAIFNLLPIPILDGGVILLLLIEMIIRRDLSLQVKEAVFKLGFVFLMAVVVFVIYNDISKILPTG
jgi:regulator of sigma E protease